MQKQLLNFCKMCLSAFLFSAKKYGTFYIGLLAFGFMQEIAINLRKENLWLFNFSLDGYDAIEQSIGV